MSKRNVLVLENEGGFWAPFLRKYFGDVPVTVHSCHKISDAIQTLTRFSPQMVFAAPSFLSMSFVQKMRVRKQTDPKFRIYLIGQAGEEKRESVFDAVFPAQPVTSEFSRKWLETVPMPESVRLLMIDDEEEITDMVRDYFGSRKAPAFEVRCVADGRQGLDAVRQEKPDIIVLDIKMPVMDGREFYAEFVRMKKEVPVVIFFDSISGEELNEIRKFGNPPVVEKGTAASSLPVLMQLVKKMVCFSA